MGRTGHALRGGVLGASLLALGPACENLQFGGDPPSSYRPLSHAGSPAPRTTTEDSPLERASRTVAFELKVAEQRLARDLPQPRSLTPRVCPDDALRQAGEPSTLHLLVRDTRYDRRQLLPLGITRRMAPDELEPIRKRFEQPDDELALHLYRRLRRYEDATASQQELADLAARPFVAVAHVLGYIEPRLTRKPGARRRHWRPGVLDTMLVVYDLRDGQSLCQVRTTVRNDTSDAPILIRLRSDTRDRLKLQLADRWREMAVRQLGQITSYLQLSTLPNDSLDG